MQINKHAVLNKYIYSGNCACSPNCKSIYFLLCGFIEIILQTKVMRKYWYTFFSIFKILKRGQWGCHCYWLWHEYVYLFKNLLILCETWPVMGSEYVLRWICRLAQKPRLLCGMCHGKGFGDVSWEGIWVYV